MTAKSKTIPARATHPAIETGTKPEPGSPGASRSEELLDPVSPYRFALYWFGIPLALVIASVFLRMQCGMGS